MEVRPIDCASSRRLLAEMTTFVAAFLHHQGTKPDGEALTPCQYRDHLTNRWAAARHGLQATFAWDAGNGAVARPVVEILDEMLDACADELAALGAKRSDLRLVNAMVAKRTCQADFVVELAGRYPDPVALTSAYSKLVRHWDVFDDYVLERAPALDPCPAFDDAAVLAEHLAVIGEGTRFYRSRHAMRYPPPVADAILRTLEEQGKIRRDVSLKRGTVLSRT
jgi:hypothetical protein